MEKYKGSYKALNSVDGSEISHDFAYYRPKGINNRKAPCIEMAKITLIKKYLDSEQQVQYCEHEHYNLINNQFKDKTPR